jgi:hypothetical protein
MSSHERPWQLSFYFRLLDETEGLPLPIRGLDPSSLFLVVKVSFPTATTTTTLPQPMFKL